MPSIALLKGYREGENQNSMDPKKDVEFMPMVAEKKKQIKQFKLKHKKQRLAAQLKAQGVDNPNVKDEDV